MMKFKREQPDQTIAERVTFAISAALLLGLVGSVIWLEAGRGDAPPSFTVTPDVAKAEERSGQWYVPVSVKNDGDETADAVRIDIVREENGEEAERSELEFTFLAGGETEEALIAFDVEPAKDDLVVDVLTSTEP